MGAMELFQPVEENVVWVRIVLDGFFVKLLLGLGGGSERVFEDVVTIAVGGLGILSCGLDLF